jgi:tricorn protease
VYLAVLDADEPSPLAPESDDETVHDAGAEENGDQDEPDDVEVHIDFDGLAERIVALDLPARAYSGLVAGTAGTLFFTEEVEDQPGLTLHRWTLGTREAKVVEEGVLGFAVSADGSRLMYRQPDHRFVVVDAAKAAAPAMPIPMPGADEDTHVLDLTDLRLKVDPPAEWRQMFREAWRFQRDYFYVDNVHGLDLDWAWATYAPWLDHVRHRADLGWLLDILGGETAVGHSFVGGGDLPEVDSVPVGLLGADYEVADGRYRFARILTGESWNPGLEAPLSGPGLDVEVGDYLLAVDGVELHAGTNLYSLFDRTAGRQTVITVNDEPDMDGARELTVVPVADEVGLRERAWIEDNRRRVDELSGGKLAYVWVPDTSSGGHRNFTRYYFAQIDKQGVVLDERFNHGGYIADYMVDLMSRELLGYFNNPVGDRQPFTAPNGAIFGPKVLIINEMSGSGGDMLPYMFRAKALGPLVGTRTWGGLVGIWDVPELVDGGYITAPRGGFYDTNGEWAVENEGVAPDVEVEQLPSLVAAGRDPQLERAVELALEAMDSQGVELLPQPPDPVRVRRPEGRD